MDPRCGRDEHVQDGCEENGGSKHPVETMKNSNEHCMWVLCVCVPSVLFFRTNTNSRSTNGIKQMLNFSWEQNERRQTDSGKPETCQDEERDQPAGVFQKSCWLVHQIMMWIFKQAVSWVLCCQNTGCLSSCRKKWELRRFSLHRRLLWLLLKPNRD